MKNNKSAKKLQALQSLQFLIKMCCGVCCFVCVVRVCMWCCVCIHVSFSFFFFSFLFSLFSFIFSFIFSFCTHRDEIRQTSDSTNYERPCTTRSTESRESYQCHNLGSSRVLSQIKPQAPLLVVPFRQCLIFMFNVLSALPGFSQEILCIAKLMTANCSAECPTQHMRRSCGAEVVQSAWFVVKTMISQ